MSGNISAPTAANMASNEELVVPLWNWETKKNLSACAEDRGLCPWMNAQNVAEYLTYRSIAASADFAVGG